MHRAPRLPDSRAGTSVHLRVLGSLLQPAAPALVAGLSLTDGLRAHAGRHLTVSPVHESGATPRVLAVQVVVVLVPLPCVIGRIAYDYPDGRCLLLLHSLGVALSHPEWPLTQSLVRH